MARRSRASPCFRPGHAHVHQRPPAEAVGKCPAPLLHKLTVNGLSPDEATNRAGNCCIDAFARSLMAQMRQKQSGGSQSEGARNRRDVQKAAINMSLLRCAGVSWLEANAAEVIWPGMTVAKLCTTVSGLPFREYMAKKQGDGEWVDTALLHALGWAHGANACFVPRALRRSNGGGGHDGEHER